LGGGGGGDASGGNPTDPLAQIAYNDVRTRVSKQSDAALKGDYNATFLSASYGNAKDKLKLQYYKQLRPDLFSNYSAPKAKAPAKPAAKKPAQSPLLNNQSPIFFTQPGFNKPRGIIMAGATDLISLERGYQPFDYTSTLPKPKAPKNKSNLLTKLLPAVGGAAGIALAPFTGGGSLALLGLGALGGAAGKIAENKLEGQSAFANPSQIALEGLFGAGGGAYAGR
jgi:hypothetical protein